MACEEDQLGGYHLRQGDGECVLGGTGSHGGQKLAAGRDSRGWLR